MSNSLHVAERAVIMAAGIGSRMYPLTLKTPKPLISVNGKRLIDTVVQALHINGIYEIYVVVGHLKEQFAPMVQEYPGLHLIENPYYKTCNNISSLYVAKEHLCNCMILDGDQMINNPEVLTPRFNRSGYNAAWCENETSEWLLDVRDGLISNCSKNGGTHGWQLYSVSRWSEEDGVNLKKYISYEFERGNHQIYWDDVPMFCHFNKFKLGIYPMKQNDIVEFDSLSELAAADQQYSQHL